MARATAVLHPGEMGAAVGACLAAHGHRVVWSSEGRSPATRTRAHAAGLAVHVAEHRLHAEDAGEVAEEEREHEHAHDGQEHGEGDRDARDRDRAALVGDGAQHDEGVGERAEEGREGPVHHRVGGEQPQESR